MTSPSMFTTMSIDCLEDEMTEDKRKLLCGQEQRAKSKELEGFFILDKHSGRHALGAVCFICIGSQCSKVFD
jgi:hypothetical protein